MVKRTFRPIKHTPKHILNFISTSSNVVFYFQAFQTLKSTFIFYFYQKYILIVKRTFRPIKHTPKHILNFISTSSKAVFSLFCQVFTALLSLIQNETNLNLFYMACSRSFSFFLVHATLIKVGGNYLLPHELQHHVTFFS